MNTYRVHVSFNIGSGFTYLLRATNIAWAAAFVSHWDSVCVERIQYPFNRRPQWHKNRPDNPLVTR